MPRPQTASSDAPPRLSRLHSKVVLDRALRQLVTQLSNRAPSLPAADLIRTLQRDLRFLEQSDPKFHNYRLVRVLVQQISAFLPDAAVPGDPADAALPAAPLAPELAQEILQSDAFAQFLKSMLAHTDDAVAGLAAALRDGDFEEFLGLDDDVAANGSGDDDPRLDDHLDDSLDDGLVSRDDVLSCLSLNSLPTLDQIMSNIGRLDRSNPLDVRMAGMEGILAYSAGDLICSEHWPQIIEVLQQALQDPHAPLAAQCLQLHARMFAAAAPVQTGEVYESLAKHLYAQVQQSNTLASFADLNLAKSPVQITVRKFRLLNAFQRQMAPHIIHYPDYLSERVFTLTFKLLSFGFNSLLESPDRATDTFSTMLPSHYMALVDPAADWFKAWFLRSQFRPLIIEHLRREAFPLLLVLYCQQIIYTGLSSTPRTDASHSDPEHTVPLPELLYRHFVHSISVLGQIVSHAEGRICFPIPLVVGGDPSVAAAAAVATTLPSISSLASSSPLGPGGRHRTAATATAAAAAAAKGTPAQQQRTDITLEDAIGALIDSVTGETELTLVLGSRYRRLVQVAGVCLGAIASQQTAAFQILIRPLFLQRLCTPLMQVAAAIAVAPSIEAIDWTPSSLFRCIHIAGILQTLALSPEGRQRVLFVAHDPVPIGPTMAAAAAAAAAADPSSPVMASPAANAAHSPSNAFSNLRVSIPKPTHTDDLMRCLLGLAGHNAQLPELPPWSESHSPSRQLLSVAVLAAIGARSPTVVPPDLCEQLLILVELLVAHPAALYLFSRIQLPRILAAAASPESPALMHALAAVGATPLGTRALVQTGVLPQCVHFLATHGPDERLGSGSTLGRTRIAAVALSQALLHPQGRLALCESPLGASAIQRFWALVADGGDALLNALYEAPVNVPADAAALNGLFPLVAGAAPGALVDQILDRLVWLETEDARMALPHFEEAHLAGLQVLAWAMSSLDAMCVLQRRHNLAPRLLALQRAIVDEARPGVLIVDALALARNRLLVDTHLLGGPSEVARPGWPIPYLAPQLDGTVSWAFAPGSDTYPPLFVGLPPPSMYILASKSADRRQVNSSTAAEEVPHWTDHYNPARSQLQAALARYWRAGGGVPSDRACVEGWRGLVWHGIRGLVAQPVRTPRAASQPPSVDGFALDLILDYEERIIAQPRKRPSVAMSRGSAEEASATAGATSEAGDPSSDDPSASTDSPQPSSRSASRRASTPSSPGRSATGEVRPSVVPGVLAAVSACPQDLSIELPDVLALLQLTKGAAQLDARRRSSSIAPGSVASPRDDAEPDTPGSEQQSQSQSQPQQSQPQPQQSQQQTQAVATPAAAPSAAASTPKGLADSGGILGSPVSPGMASSSLDGMAHAAVSEMLLRPADRPAQGSGVDWFAACVALVVQDEAAAVELLATYPRHFGSLFLWPQRAQAVAGGVEARLALLHLVESVLATEYPLVFNTFKRMGLMPGHVVDRWIAQCFLNILDWPGVVQYLVTCLVQGIDYQVYFCVAVVCHLHAGLVVHEHAETHLQYLLEPIRGFRIADWFGTMQSLEASYRPLCMGTLTAVVREMATA